MSVLDEIAKAKEPKKPCHVRLNREDYDDVSRLAKEYGLSQTKLIGIAVRLLERSINDDLAKVAAKEAAENRAKLLEQGYEHIAKGLGLRHENPEDDAKCMGTASATGPWCDKCAEQMA